MDAVVDIPPSKTVVVSESGTKYHRQSSLPWRDAGCPTDLAPEIREIPLLEAEKRGYDPCCRADCFGEPSGNGHGT